MILSPNDAGAVVTSEQRGGLRSPNRALQRTGGPALLAPGR